MACLALNNSSCNDTYFFTNRLLFISKIYGRPSRSSQQAAKPRVLSNTAVEAKPVAPLSILWLERSLRYPRWINDDDLEGSLNAFDLEWRY
jgi:hypothetical protein